MTTSTYMGLESPTPEVTEGPDWAELLNALILLIDAHDHSTGKGTKVTQSGLTFTDALDMVQQAISNVKQVTLYSQASIATAGAIYRVGNNLWYNNSAGVAIQLTSGSSVNASGTGDISLDTIASYPYLVVAGDAQKVKAIDTSAARTINLPAATTAMFFIAKDVTGSAQTNNISFVPDGSDTIDGDNSTFLGNINYGSWSFVSDGVSAWYLV